MISISYVCVTSMAPRGARPVHDVSSTAAPRRLCYSIRSSLRDAIHGAVTRVTTAQRSDLGGCSREENIVTTSTREVQVMPVFVKDPLNSQVHGMVGQYDLS